jgi:hypothetical protein
MVELEWMMWQIDNAQTDDPPALNLIRAIQYYTEKYGGVPNRCEVHKDALAALHAPPGILVTGSKAVKRGCLMLARDPSLDAPIPGRP